MKYVSTSATLFSTWAASFEVMNKGIYLAQLRQNWQTSSMLLGSSVGKVAMNRIEYNFNKIL
jgi:hypothetical protein